jgi:hypothetical protein
MLRYSSQNLPDAPKECFRIWRMIPNGRRSRILSDQAAFRAGATLGALAPSDCCFRPIAGANL